MQQPLSVYEKREQLEKWLQIDTRGLTDRTIHALYNREKSKRARLIYKEFFQ